MHNRYALLFLMSFYSLGAAALEMSGSPAELRSALEPDYPEVTIVGKAERTTYSNIAQITIVVTTKENTISESLSKNSEIRQSLIQSLTNAGIPNDAIKNSEFSSSPHYGLFRGKKPSKYTVENSLRVTARNGDQLLSVNRSIDSIDAAELGEISFEVEDEERLKEELKLEAISDAKRRSQSYGKALDLELIPKSFSFEQVHPNRGMQIEEVVVTARRVSGSRSSFQDEPAAESVSFEQMEYRSSVKVVYESRRSKE